MNFSLASKYDNTILIDNPKKGDTFKSGDILTVKAYIDKIATYAILTIGNRREFKNLLESENEDKDKGVVTFSDYTFTDSDIGNLDVKVEVGRFMYLPSAIHVVQVLVEGSGDNKWIPDIMQLNGSSKQEKYLSNLINSINDKISKNNNFTQVQKEALLWDQSKIDIVWAENTDFYDKNGVVVDPRLLLAILFKEGTGSFNTSSTNLASDGQNGVNLNFNSDLKLAIDLLGGKIAAYSYFQSDFSKARNDAYNQNLLGISNYDDIFHYLNWETPRLKLDSVGFDTGVYAGNNTWHRCVREFYSGLAYDDISQDYTNYAISLGQNKILELANKYGITINEVVFSPVKSGQNSDGSANGEYTIAGTIK